MEATQDTINMMLVEVYRSLNNALIAFATNIELSYVWPEVKQCSDSLIQELSKLEDKNDTDPNTITDRLTASKIANLNHIALDLLGIPGLEYETGKELITENFLPLLEEQGDIAIWPMRLYLGYDTKIDVEQLNATKKNLYLRVKNLTKGLANINEATQ